MLQKSNKFLKILLQGLIHYNTFPRNSQYAVSVPWHFIRHKNWRLKKPYWSQTGKAMFYQHRLKIAAWAGKAGRCTCI